MTKDFIKVQIDLLKARCKYNKAVENCAEYFLNKLYKKKAEGFTDIEAGDL